MMETYLCRFEDEDLCGAEWREIKAFDPDAAASKFAEYAYHAMDMWEEDPDWGDEYAILVKSPDGSITRWTVSVTLIPHFLTRQSVRKTAPEAS